ncbi:azurin [Moraxella caviae]|uniref:Azurin n=1 Tax=Moraxella caviae TaxID=34060 RepID=A0A1T0A519_9GAMM|nr:azurin [Moraxella caviae]OOR90814.1 azurin [Moraxella caviae]STZ10641.1 Outer membrane protein H.8 precursor [Moraxella caviae]
MKAQLALLSLAALGLTACGGDKPAETPAPAETAAPAEAPAQEAAETTEATEATETTETPAEEAKTEETAAVVDEKCTAIVESDDKMKFNTSTLQVNKACPEFVVTLKHTGKMPRASMGHNIVITKADDVTAVAADGAAAGAAAGFIKAGDERVVAASELIGGGEETTFTIDPTKLTDGNYEFFCSFPGHVGVMKGKVTLVES